jgi:cobalt-zinc-cadmium efflux system protein
MTEAAHGEAEASRRVLRGLALTVALALVALAIEAAGAVLSRSLALTVDAVHNIPDLLAFSVSYLSLAGTAVGATATHSFGRHRAEVFAAILNGLIILVVGGIFAYTAVVSLLQGTPFGGPVNPAWILFAAAPVFALRAVSVVYLRRTPRPVRDLNVRSVILHLASDLVITATLLVDAALLFAFPQAEWVDPAAALFIAAILVYESIPILRDGWEVLTERVPRGVSLEDVRTALGQVPHVREVHDLHVWSVCPTFVCLTAHVQVDEMAVSEAEELTAELRERAVSQFGILHSVFELEAAKPSDAGLSPSRGAPSLGG